MSGERVDDETLAAFIDGTLPPAERERVLHVLASDPEAYADFLESSRILAELEAGAASGTVSADHGSRLAPEVAPANGGLPRRWPRVLSIAAPFLAAAGIAGILLFPGRSAAPDTIALMQGVTLARATGDGSVSRTLGEGWDQPGWSVVRGAESNASPGTAARIGARVAQLEYAAGARDSVAYRQVQLTIGALLAAVEGTGPIVAGLAQLAISDSTGRARLASQLRAVTGETSAFDIGAWLETARLAAMSGHDDYLAPDGAAVATLRALLTTLDRAPPAGDWSVILSQLREIARQPGDPALTRARVDSAMAAIPR